MITLARSPDGNYAISTGSENDVILWDLRTGQEVWRYPAFAWAVAFSPDGRTALLSNITVLSGEEGELVLLDVETGREIQRFGPPPSGVQSLAFSPDGRTAVSGGMGRIIILWDVTTGQEIRRFTGYELEQRDHSPEGTWNVGFTPDGRQVLTSFIYGTIVVWDTATGNRIHELVGNQATSGYSFGAQVVVTTDSNGAATLWDISTGTVLRRLSLPVSTTNVQISPDNRLAMSGTVENTTVLWDLQTGAVVRRWSGSNNGAVAIAFGPDGHDAVVGLGDGRVELWRIDASIDELLAWTAANRYIPELTCEQRAFYRLEPSCPEQPFD